MTSIAITGPESTGKSWLAEALTRHYAGLLVPEYARTYLETLSSPYTSDDVSYIARQQHRMIHDGIAAANKHSMVIADTELMVISIWLEHKYGIEDLWVEEQLIRQPFSLYLLCDIDMPWTYDPLREHPHQREELMEKYVKKITDLRLPHGLVQGNGESRLQNALQCIEKHFAQKRC